MFPGFLLSATPQVMTTTTSLVWSFPSHLRVKYRALLSQPPLITNSAAFELRLRKFLLITLLLMEGRRWKLKYGIRILLRLLNIGKTKPCWSSGSENHVKTREGWITFNVVGLDDNFLGLLLWQEIFLCKKNTKLCFCLVLQLCFLKHFCGRRRKRYVD